jgi:DNA-binding SARP family transcriptional activator
MKLYITTLGEFDMCLDGQSVMQDASRSYKLFKLLQYFLTFKNKKLLPETIIDNLWQEHESTDPKNMIRGQIFRLRQILKSILPSEEYLNINFSNGYYTLEVSKDVTIDIDIMERLIQEGNELLLENREAAIKAYRDAANIYEVWLVPVRSYYKRLYVKTIESLVTLYTEKDDNESVVTLCEEAISIEPYEEKLHIFMIESLLKLGKIKNALNHFEFMQVAFEKDMGITSTSAMRDIQRRIQNYTAEKSDLDIKELDKKLNEKDKEGPLLCESEYFKFLYNSQKRRRKLEGEVDFICLITLKSNGNGSEKYEEYHKSITEILDHTLRKGDIYTFWNDTQVLLLLPDVKEDGINSIEKRIKNKHNSTSNHSFNMYFKFVPIDHATKLKF